MVVVVVVVVVVVLLQAQSDDFDVWTTQSKGFRAALSAYVSLGDMMDARRRYVCMIAGASLLFGIVVGDRVSEPQWQQYKSRTTSFLLKIMSF